MRAQILTFLLVGSLVATGGCGESTSTADAVSKAKADQMIADAKAQAKQIKEDASAQAAASAKATTDSAEPATASASSAGTHGLPNLVGKGLQYAQDQAQARGFSNLTSHDATDRGRVQIIDSNWKVCSQKPAPGSSNQDAKVDLGAVKTGESCPSSDQNTPVKKAGPTMPNLVGKSASTAEDALPDASIDFEDGTGDGRTLIIASNWRVCDQDPSAGAPYDGVPVTLTVVKYGEGC